MKMPIGIAEFMIDCFVKRYSKVLIPKLSVQILHKRSVFDIRIVSPMQSVEVFSCG